jgi:hypothetical protein
LSVTKFNRTGAKPNVHSPIATETTPSGRTYEGGAGFARADAKSELFLLAVTNMVSENSFYEKADERDARFEDLVHRVAVDDGDWFSRFVPWLRNEANMRSASLVVAAEAVKARLDAGIAGGNRTMIDAACQRADEPGEMLAYWVSRHGRALPKPVKRGVADAAARLYSGKSLLKYDTSSKGYRFGDVIDLVHPTPDSDKPWQGDVFRYALDRRHHPDTATPPESNRTLTANRALLAMPVAERRALLGRADAVERLAQAGFSWEMLAGWLQGPMDAQAWSAVIPSMGLMAQLRNLRNFDQAGVTDATVAPIVARLTDPQEIARSRQFPFRFLAAYKHAPSLRWAYPLEQALGHSLGNVPALPGRTLVLVDRSGSMFGSLSERTQLNRADSAAIFGSALALRAHSADLVQFGTHSQPIRFGRGESVLRLVERFGNLGGTNTVQAVSSHYRAHDRVVIVTDEQAAYGGHGDVTAAVPAQVPVYTWNLAGYRYGHAPSGGHNRHTFGGLTDQAFKVVPLLESGRDGGWPF